jgi:hypothetical protein
LTFNFFALLLLLSFLFFGNTTFLRFFRRLELGKSFRFGLLFRPNAFLLFALFSKLFGN